MLCKCPRTEGEGPGARPRGRLWPSSADVGLNSDWFGVLGILWVFSGVSFRFLFVCRDLGHRKDYLRLVFKNL